MKQLLGSNRAVRLKRTWLSVAVLAPVLALSIPNSSPRVIHPTVVAATGAGNTSATLLEAGQRAMGARIPLVLVTRTPAGRAGTGYAFPGGGATWVRAGAMLAGTLSGPKARVALSFGIGAGLDAAALAALLAGPEEGG